jgi:hypothetical protein
VIGPEKVDHIESECFGVVVACVFEGDRQSNLPEGDGLLARDHFIEWVWVIFELVPISPSLSKVSRYMSLRALPPSTRAFVSRVVLTSGSTMRGNLPGFGILFE